MAHDSNPNPISLDQWTWLDEQNMGRVSSTLLTCAAVVLAALSRSPQWSNESVRLHNGLRGRVARLSKGKSVTLSLRSGRDGVVPINCDRDGLSYGTKSRKRRCSWSDVEIEGPLTVERETAGMPRNYSDRAAVIVLAEERIAFVADVEDIALLCYMSGWIGDPSVA
ncbi:hypothetical protein BH10ACT8_BH10ACT8_29330 [soil metagenome]